MHQCEKRNEAVSSSIQTLLSVSELHRICAEALADFTAGRESHPALKNSLFTLLHEHSTWDETCQVFFFVIK